MQLLLSFFLSSSSNDSESISLPASSLNSLLSTGQALLSKFSNRPSTLTASMAFFSTFIMLRKECMEACGCQVDACTSHAWFSVSFACGSCLGLFLLATTCFRDMGPKFEGQTRNITKVMISSSASCAKKAERIKMFMRDAVVWRKPYMYGHRQWTRNQGVKCGALILTVW